MNPAVVTNFSMAYHAADSQNCVNLGRRVGQESYRLFVGGLSLHTTDLSLKKYMEQFEGLQSVQIVKKGGLSKGYAFLEFNNLNSATRVTTITHHLDGRHFNCSFTVDEKDTFKKIIDEKYRKLYVKGVSQRISEDDIHNYFNNFGRVSRVTINKHPNDRYKGTAFILFESDKTVDFLLNNASNVHNIQGKEVRIFECLTKNEIFKFLKRKKKTSPVFNASHNQPIDQIPDSISIKETNIIGQNMPSLDLHIAKSNPACPQLKSSNYNPLKTVCSLENLGSFNLGYMNQITQAELPLQTLKVKTSTLLRTQCERCTLEGFKPSTKSRSRNYECKLCYLNMFCRQQHETVEHNYRFNLLSNSNPRMHVYSQLSSRQ